MCSRSGDEVGADLQGPAQVVAVLLAQGRHGDGDAGQVNALVVGHVAGHLDTGDDVGIDDDGNAHRDVAVVDEQAVAGAAVARQALEGRGAALDRAKHVLDRDRELVTLKSSAKCSEKSCRTELRC